MHSVSERNSGRVRVYDSRPIRRNLSLGTIESRVVLIAIISILIREPFQSAILYYISGSKISYLWYIPDALFVCCFLIFIRLLIVQGSVFLATYIPLYVISAMIVGTIVTGSYAAAVAGFKLAVPIFVGLCCKRELLQSRPVIFLSWIVMALAVVGIFYSMVGQLPWDGVDFDIQGRVKQSKSIMYMYGERRASGFSSDAHGAAFSVLLPFFLLFSYKRSLKYYLSIPIVLFAVFETTSRTTLFAILAFIFVFVLIDHRLLKRKSLDIIVVLVSIFIIFIPLVVIIWAASVSQSSVSYDLQSLWARGNDSWLQPFRYMDKLAPMALLHGYGFGGVGYPLFIANMDDYYVPVDNFHLYNIYQFGIGYILIFALMVWSVVRTDDIVKKVWFCSLSIWATFLLGYGNPMFMLLYGFCFQGLSYSFARRGKGSRA